MMRSFRSSVLVLLLPAILASGCSRLASRAAYRDGNGEYKQENFRKAIEQYERAVAADPSFAEAHFYLANSHQALFRPGKEGPDNKAHLDKAIESYKKSLEGNKADTPQLKMLRRNALGFLSSIYSDDAYRSYEDALHYAQALVDDAPGDVKGLFTLASLQEKFEKIPEAEALYKKVAEDNPQDAKACGALAGFYNKPLWDGRSKFDDAVSVLDRCASLNPNDETGYYKIATFFWDKAYRDRTLSTAEKDQYADKGLLAVDKALDLKPDYVEALVYKGLLYRVKAAAIAVANPRTAQAYLDKANALRDQATEIRKQLLASGSQAAPQAGS
jgi:tetratricopeptide (TPR) repeat protein